MFNLVISHFVAIWIGCFNNSVNLPHGFFFYLLYIPYTFLSMQLFWAQLTLVCIVLHNQRALQTTLVPKRRIGWGKRPGGVYSPQM